jgi:hypothetical protein
MQDGYSYVFVLKDKRRRTAACSRSACVAMTWKYPMASPPAK